MKIYYIKMALLKLDPYILEHISTFLYVDELQNLWRTCKRLNNYFRSRLFWKIKLRRDLLAIGWVTKYTQIKDFLSKSSIKLCVIQPWIHFFGQSFDVAKMYAKCSQDMSLHEIITHLCKSSCGSTLKVNDPVHLKIKGIDIDNIARWGHWNGSNAEIRSILDRRSCIFTWNSMVVYEHEPPTTSSNTWEVIKPFRRPSKRRRKSKWHGDVYNVIRIHDA